MKQKRMTSGMIQASDLRHPSGRRMSNGNKRELHGICSFLCENFKAYSKFLQDMTGLCNIP